MEIVAALLSNNILPTNLLSLLKIQSVIKSHSFMPGASNLATMIFLTVMLFHFWHSLSCSK